MADSVTVCLPGRLLAVETTAGPAGASKGGGDHQEGPAASRNASGDEMLRKAQSLAQAEREELVRARQALEDGVEKLRQFEAELLEGTEEQLLDLALGIARRVLMQEIQADRYEIEPIVKEALLHVPTRRDVLVHLHPDDWKQSQTAEEGSKAGDSGGVRFVADASVQRAECVLETTGGVVESTVDTHLENIAEALKNPE